MPASPSVVYFELMPGFQAFRCEPLKASLSAKSCAANHAERRNESCVQCAIGRHHADQHGLRVHRAKPTGVCVRCERRTTRRMLEHGICISCYNRQREVLRGRNGKGVRPLLQLYTADVLIEGQAPAHGFSIEPVAPGAWLVSFLARDEAELQRALSTICADSSAMVLDWSIGPLRRLEVTHSDHYKRRENGHAWNSPRDPHQNTPRSHSHGLHQNSRAARPPARAPA